MPYGIILLPDPNVAEVLTRYSNEIAGPAATMSLDLGKRPPHLTLLHIDADREVADEWWSEVSQLIQPSLPVRLTGLAFVPMTPGGYYVPEGGIAISASAANTTALREAHHQALDVAIKIGAETLGAVGDDFNPHVSLAVVQQMTAVTMPDILTSSFNGHLVLGRLGDYGSFPEILERAS